MKIEIERSYDITGKRKTSRRFLVDRLWPRGIKKEVLQLDLWVKELSPSNELRKWYDHDPRKWEGFKERYFKELDKWSEELEKFMHAIEKHKKITLIYSSTEREINNAVALKEYLLEQNKF
jgi:uncharacterized protein YeaO (DUF488 family)